MSQETEPRNIINVSLNAAEQAKFQKHLSFIPEVVKGDVLKSVAIAKLPGAGEGLLIATESKLAFIVAGWSNFGKPKRHHEILYVDVDWTMFSQTHLTVRKKRGMFREQQYEFLSETREQFVQCLSKHIDIRDQNIFQAEQQQEAETEQQRKEEIESLTNESIKKIRNEAHILDTTLAGRDFEQLPSILEEDETVYAVVSGFYEHNIGVLVLTDKRILFVDKGIINLTVEEFYLNDISSVRYHTGMVGVKSDYIPMGTKRG